MTAALSTFLGVVFLLLALIAVPCTYIQDGIADITDPACYERALKLSSLPDHLKGIFPEKIQEYAENVRFYDRQFAIGQGGQEIALEFETDPDTLGKYIKLLSLRAKWAGKEGSSEAAKHGIFTGTLSVFNDSESDADDTVYVLSGMPYGSDWNHGENSFVAINKEDNTILFWAGTW